VTLSAGAEETHLLPRWHTVQAGQLSPGLNAAVRDIEVLPDGRFVVAYIGGIVDVYGPDFQRIRRIGPFADRKSVV
jgi:hypothetical protein